METMDDIWNNINEILNRQKIEKSITEILLQFDDLCNSINFKKGIYIHGVAGSGKSKFVESILKKNDYDIVRYDCGDVRNKNLIDSITSDNISNYNVLDMMKKKKKKIAIIMDEIDGMNNGDKGGVAALVKLIRQKKTKKQRLENISLNPIICISNNLLDKKTKELMKVCNVFELKTPTKQQVINILTKVNVSLETTMMNKLVDYIQGDLRKLEFICKTLNTGDTLDAQFLHSILHQKSRNDDSKKVVSQLFETPVKIEEHNSIINENDRTIVSLLWHENVIDHLELNKIKNPIHVYLRMLDNICYADYIDRITFQNQIWQFNEMSSLMKTFFNNKIFHDAMFKEKKRRKYTVKLQDIRFTKILTKYSTEYNNQLFIYNMCQALDMDKKDLVAFFQEMRFYVKDITERSDVVEKIFDNTDINILDVKRMYRFLDKNVKKEIEMEC